MIAFSYLCGSPWHAIPTDTPAVDKWLQKSEGTWEEAREQISQAVQQFEDRH